MKRSTKDQNIARVSRYAFRRPNSFTHISRCPTPPFLSSTINRTTSYQGAILTEFREIGEDPWEYVRDRWNVLDVTSLCFMFVSLCFRAFDHVDSITARSLYALSAPLAFTRILFFAQILPSQGPMIQVISRQGGGGIFSRQGGGDGGAMGIRKSRL